VTTEEIVPMLKALADPTRLRIFEFLRNECCEVSVDDHGDVRPIRGATVGEVCCQIHGTEQIPSSLSFHLKELRNCGLVETRKQGKYVLCAVNREAVTKLSQFFGVTNLTKEEHL
jgi:ArsR family transcriptional regulator, arsenate/arsenite/antimonite-responsive transcriptional repressor